jgi:hypothetical protein
MIQHTLEAAPEPRWEPTGLVTTLLSSGARNVIRCWLDLSRFRDEHHHPRMLPMEKQEPGTFQALVHEAGENLVPAVVLNELLRKGIVETLDSGHVLLRRSAYAPFGGEIENIADQEFSFDLAAPKRRYNDQ